MKSDKGRRVSVRLKIRWTSCKTQSDQCTSYVISRLTSPAPATVQRDAEGGSKKFMSSGLQSRKLRDLCHSFIQQAATESLKPKFSEGTSESPINSPHFDLPVLNYIQPMT